MRDKLFKNTAKTEKKTTEASLFVSIVKPS